MTKVSEVIEVLELIAPTEYQESYDNSGLLIGNPHAEVKGALITLDVTEEVIEEALELECNLIVAHHPLIFKGLKRLSGNHWVQRCTRSAIKNELAIYAIHTNLDNVLGSGVNGKIADQIGLKGTSVLVPKSGLLSFEIVAPALLRNDVLAAIAALEPMELIESDIRPALPASGAKPGFKIEGVIRPHKKNAVGKIAQQYNLKVFFNKTDGYHPHWGSGVLGELELPMPERSFLEFLKEKMNTQIIRHTALMGKSVSRVAVCGGSGSTFLGASIAAGADVYISGDFKYHDFFEADEQIVIADIGHYESEQFTSELLFDIISKNFSTFALHCTKVNTNPINYF